VNICRGGEPSKQGGVLETRKGTKANELIMVTVEGEVPCRIMEDDIFIIFEMPSGKNDLGAPKLEFLDALSSGKTRNDHPPDEAVPTDR
jgi:hypothetical protein